MFKNSAPLRALTLICLSCFAWGFVFLSLLRPSERIAEPIFLKPQESDLKINFKVHSPVLAKEKGLLWMQNSSGEGYALSLWSNPSLFNALFPGFPLDTIQDASLHRDYFSRAFETDIHLDFIAKQFAPEFTIVLPWLGCLDLYKRAGADIVIIGTSETFRGLIVDQIAKDLKNLTRFQLQNPKVLMCAGSALQIESATSLIKKMRELNPRAKPILIYGQSYSVAFTEGARNLNNLKEKRAELFQYDLKSARAKSKLFVLFEDFHHISFADLFPRWNWQTIFPTSYADLLEERNKANLPEKAMLPNDPQLKFRFVTKKIISNPDDLTRDITNRMHPYYKVYDDFIDTKHCESNERRQKLKELFAEISNLTSTAFIFIPPSTPLVFNAVPPCLKENLKNELLELSQAYHFYLKTDDWKSFGLDYTDYVRPTNHPDVYRVDVQHTNYKGAQKVTTQLSNWIQESIQK